MSTAKTKKKLIEQAESTAILDSVKTIKINDVVSQVNNLQVSVQKTLADLCATVTTKVQQMDQLDTAIDLKTARLQELYNIEKDAVSLEEIRSRKEEETLNWEKDRSERRKRQEEDELEFTKTRNRNEDNWKYEFEQRKKRFAEEFDAEVLRNKRNEQNRHEALEKNWLDRETALKAKEQEYQNLILQVSGFDAKLAEAVKAAEGRGFAAASAKYNHETALLKKDAESAKAISDMKITTLSHQIASLENQIEDLQKQVVSARADSKEIASEALKSSANKQLSDTLQKVVMDQQSNSKSK